MSDETRDRFLRLIAEQVRPDRIEELHLFAPMRQGGRETGVAVIAAHADASADHATPDHAPLDDVSLYVASPDGVSLDDAIPHDESPAFASVDVSPVQTDDVSLRVERLIIYRAQYQLVLKGPDRGKWEADVRAEADAPLSAVDEVVRGVHRRAGEDAEPERLSGDAVRAALLAVAWRTPT